MTTQVFNTMEEKKKRRLLRKNFSQAELLVWSKLRSKQLGSYKFRRQYSVGPYVVDFYCPAGKLAIEIDGDSHYQKNSAVHDRTRQDFIEHFGVRFLRFTNTEVFENLEGVMEKVEATLKNLTLTLPLEKGREYGI